MNCPKCGRELLFERLWSTSGGRGRSRYSCIFDETIVIVYPD